MVPEKTYIKKLEVIDYGLSLLHLREPEGIHVRWSTIPSKINTFKLFDLI
jgi:hypothetical protein